MVQVITNDTDFPVLWDDPTHAELQWKWDDMHCPQALTPLAADYMIRPLSEGVNYYFQQAGQPVEWIGRHINGYIYFTSRLGRPESERDAIDDEFRKVDLALSLTIHDYWDNEALPLLRETYDWLRSAPVETASPAELAELWAEGWKRAARVWGIHFMTVAGCYQCLDTLIDVYEALIEGAGSSEALSLVQGHPGDLHRVERDLYSLAQQVGRSPSLLQFLHERAEWLPQEVTSVDGGPEFLQAMHDFLRDHGHLGQPFDDLSYPSWEDQPALLIAEIRKRLDGHREDPEQLRARLRHQADDLADRARERLVDRPEDLARFEEALSLARTGGSLSEDHNYWLDRMMHAHFHRFVVRVGQRLVEGGVLAEPRDIFYLYLDEVSDTLRSGKMPNLSPLVAERKSALEKQRTLRPPKIVGKARETPDVANRFSPRPTEATEAGILRGTGACAGKATGTARVVLSPSDFEKVQPGDILICPASNPSWVPLYGIIGGLVTNTGGVLAHAAVTAREFGVPAVVGVGKATEIIRDGQTLEIDGAAGIVRLL